ncbi:MAG: tripartite tricarboxylate transporter permease [Desulfobacterota bacterium]|nr:tripartite tricarboxylate transporter permease [Thermodesulfobacteriota bacterium]
MLDIWLGAIQNVFNPLTLLIIWGGVLLGVILGSVPGLNSTMGTALLIPFTFAMSPINGLALLSAVYCGGTYGGSISAILFNVPGAPEASATVFDGYEMAKKGKAAQALGFAVMCSCLGGLFSVVVMTLVSPLLARVALTFSQPEYFALAITALTLIASLGGRGMKKAAISGVFGLLMATVGIDPMTGDPRFTFGGKALIGGINFIPAIIGAFAVGEILARSETRLDTKEVFLEKVSTKLPKLKEILRMKWLVLRSALIGTWIGILPGVGATTAAFVGYAEAVRWSKNPEKFGTGIPEGIAAPETANNAATGGAMVPLLTLGIPGSATTAVIIGGFLVHGLQPGPMLFMNQPKLMYSIFLAMFLANILMLFAGLGVAKVFSNFRRIRYSILGPCIFIFAAIGSYGIRNDPTDLWIMFFFGVIGYFMKRYNYPIAPMIIGLVLGNLTEISLRRGMRMVDYDLSAFLFRPIAGIILAIALISILYSVIRKKPKIIEED